MKAEWTFPKRYDFKVAYEIYNHEEGTITFFEHYENVERWEEDNEENPNGYKEYGLRITTSAETDVWYKTV